MDHFLEPQYLGHVRFKCDSKIRYTVNVIGETLVLKKYFAGFLLGKSLLYAGQKPIFSTFLP